VAREKVNFMTKLGTTHSLATQTNVAKNQITVRRQCASVKQGLLSPLRCQCAATVPVCLLRQPRGGFPMHSTLGQMSLALCGRNGHCGPNRTYLLCRGTRHDTLAKPDRGWDQDGDTGKPCVCVCVCNPYRLWLFAEYRVLT
jgi:hypothetical protein